MNELWIGSHNNLELALETVHAAVHKRRVTNLLLHSDQGFQYPHKQYHALLKRKRMEASMSRNGGYWDSACIEVFGHFSRMSPTPHFFERRPADNLHLI
ncbi:hypothetical protein PC41400_00290 [Paenibacillus chitinolyticus]|uniref:Integrase catalytic domain-containing protein n=1 Tax=Paenibacillus chitinolyticus TaxID=79263 RepID=A0A410WP98_9BACL|nr:hypothetical protein PC41400_00290 [Paenibacillus chitinolyticus]